MVNERYRQKQRLGGGVTGEVWLATDTMLGREVAIKYLNSVEDDVHRDLFMAEARMLARLHHPGITTLFDAALGDGGYYLIMEYVAGQPLSQFIETGAYSLPEALDLGIDVLTALRYAHAQGVIHRDIKPDNVLITPEGAVKLTDFGFANLVSILRVKGDYQLGTPAYMPPEQFQGLAQPGSDLYAFGVLLYEMLTGGRLPFDDDNRLLIETWQTSPTPQPPPRPTPLRDYLPDAPLVLEHLLNRLLAAAPAERYPDAEAVLNVLRPIRARLQLGGSRVQLLTANDDGPPVGRDAHRLALQHAWQQTWAARRAQLVLVAGEAGVGKTRLVADFLSRTTAYPVFVGRGSEDDLPYAPFIEVMSRLIQRFPAVAGACTPAQQQHLAAHLPGVAGWLPAFNEPLPPVPAPQAQMTLFETCRLMFEQLGPAIVWLEDVTHLDESSQALLRFLRRRLTVPLLFVATCRSDEAPAPWWAGGEPPLTLELEPLSEADTGLCLAGLLNGPVDPQAVSAVYRRSHGNPLFIEETRRHMQASGELVRNEAGEWVYRRQGRSGSLPPTLVNIFQRRLSRLSIPARQALSLAALLGAEFDFAVWVEALADQRLALDSLDESLALRLLVDHGDDRYRFNPSNLAPALADSLSSSRRRLAHSRLLDILRRRPGVEPAQIAPHAQAAGLTAEAATCWQEAGRRAAAANAPGAAIAAFEAANALAPALENHETLGGLYRQQGQSQPAIAALKQAYALAETPAERARVLNSLAFVYWLYDQYEPARQAAAAALRLPGAPAESQAVAHSHLGMIAWLRGQFGPAESHCAAAVKTLRAMLAEPELPAADQRRLADLLAGAANRLGLVAISLGRFQPATSAVTMALRLRERLGDVWGEAFCRNNLARIAIDENEPGAAQQQLRQAEQLFSRIDSQDGLMVVYANRGRLRLARSEPAAAQTALNEALRLAIDIGKWSAYGLGDIYLLLAEAKMALGEPDRAEAALNEALRLVETAGNTEYIALGYALRSRLRREQGDAAAAVHSRDLAAQHAAATGSAWLEQRARRLAGEAAYA